MRLGVLFSGGKDSVFAMFKAMEGNEIVCLISVLSENKESYMFHTPNIHLTELQAKAIGIPLLTGKTKGIKEEELVDLKKVIEKAVKKYKIQGIVTGALASNYQATRIQKICDELKIECINPLWMRNQVEYLKELISSGFEVIVTGVFAEPLTEKWLGRKIDDEAIKELAKLQKTKGINPAGEGGEIETLVLDGPIFKKKLKIIKAKTTYNNYTGIYEIKEAKLVKK